MTCNSSVAINHALNHASDSPRWCPKEPCHDLGLDDLSGMEQTTCCRPRRSSHSHRRVHELEFALGPSTLMVQDPVSTANFDVARDGDRFGSNTTHRGFLDVRITGRWRRAPPTFCSRQIRSESTPRLVETMQMPRPAKGRGRSEAPR